MTPNEEQVLEADGNLGGVQSLDGVMKGLEGLIYPEFTGLLDIVVEYLRPRPQKRDLRDDATPYDEICTIHAVHDASVP